MSNKQNKNITKRDEDFAKWYTDIVREANLACYSNVKGCIVIEPNGYAIWENIQKELDKMFKETGHKNISMPLLIPENLMKKESVPIKKIEIAENLLERNVNIDIIAESTGLSKEELKNLKKVCK